MVKISLTSELAGVPFIPWRNLSVLSMETLGSASISGSIVSVEAWRAFTGAAVCRGVAVTNAQQRMADSGVARHSILLEKSILRK